MASINARALAGPSLEANKETAPFEPSLGNLGEVQYEAWGVDSVPCHIVCNEEFVIIPEEGLGSRMALAVPQRPPWADEDDDATDEGPPLVSQQVVQPTLFANTVSDTGTDSRMMCKFFLRGRCSRGRECRFRHEGGGLSAAKLGHTLGPDAVFALGELLGTSTLLGALKTMQGLQGMPECTAPFGIFLRRMVSGLLEISGLLSANVFRTVTAAEARARLGL